MIRILSFPSRHPYTSKLVDKKNFAFVNPYTDYFANNNLSAAWLDKKHPPTSYDIVHIHFSYDSIEPKDLEELLQYFKKNRKRIVWTCHSLISQNEKDNKLGHARRILLFKYSDKVICPTSGCSQELEKECGRHRAPTSVIPLGFMAHPDDVSKLSKNTRKDRYLFTMLVGDFRKNKDFLGATSNFLQDIKLQQYKIKLIYKPLEVIVTHTDTEHKDNILQFFKLIKSGRAISFSLPEIPHKPIVESFIQSHAIILPYKWGTHSGQIELAKDCGCHVVASRVGFFDEQGGNIQFFDTLQNKAIDAASFINAITRVTTLPSIEPLGIERVSEHKRIINAHHEIYNNLLV